ncbi:MAG: FkbM family methyltransferase [Bacteroidota bacterium]
MKNYTKRTLTNLLHKLNIIRAPQTDIQTERVRPWFLDNGDNTHRVNYDLTIDSLVFDLGGYEGQWSNTIFDKYGCSIFIFEPVTAFADNIKKRFEANPKIEVFPYGLSAETTRCRLAIHDDATSAFKTGKETAEIELRSAEEFFKERHIGVIDLMKINIEGGEYDLLDHLIATGSITQIRNIQVQFHDFVPDAEIRMKAIQDRLRKTHRLTYQYLFVWENWERI